MFYFILTNKEWNVIRIINFNTNKTIKIYLILTNINIVLNKKIIYYIQINLLILFVN